MDVNLLGMYGTKLVHYSSKPEKSILHLLTYQTTLIMEPGELADFAKGHRFLTNSTSRIIVLNPGDYYLAPEGDYFQIFMPVDVVSKVISVGAGYWAKARTYRRITCSSYLPTFERETI